MKLFVLHPGSPLPEQDFGNSLGQPAALKVPPVGDAGFAACTGGAFVRKATSIPESEKRVLLLLDEDLKKARQATIDLRRAGKTIVLAFANASAQGIHTILKKPGSLALLQETCNRAHAAIATSREVEPVFRACGMLYVESILPPLPLEETAWDVSIAPELRTGIFLGSWDWTNPSRNHRLALLGLREVASQMYEPVTVFNLDGWWGRRWLRQLQYPSGLLQVVERRLPYVDYLRILAKHKVVFHLDSSGAVGRIAADALLARIPCIGGNGSMDRLLFPELCERGNSSGELLQTLARVLDHGHERDEAVDRALEIARPLLSMEKVEQTLEGLFHYLG
jgi:hypothetical protein